MEVQEVTPAIEAFVSKNLAYVTKWIRKSDEGLLTYHYLRLNWDTEFDMFQKGWIINMLNFYGKYTQDLMQLTDTQIADYSLAYWNEEELAYNAEGKESLGRTLGIILGQHVNVEVRK